MIVLTGCHSAAPSRPIPTPSVLTSPSSAVATIPAAGTVSCGDVIGSVPAPELGLTVVDDAVAVPAAGRMPGPLQVSADRGTEVGTALFAKAGLEVRQGTRVRLRVLEPAAGRAWIGWGSPAAPGPTVIVDGCRGTDTWIAFAGGYWVRTPMCVPIGVRVADGAEHRLRVAVGAACPQ